LCMAWVMYGEPIMVPIRVSWDCPDPEAETFNLYTKKPDQQWILQVEGKEWWTCKNRPDCGKQFSYTHLVNILWIGRIEIGVASVDASGNVSEIVAATWEEVTH